MGFWTSEELKEFQPEIVSPFDPKQVENCSYELRMGREAFVSASGELAAKKYLEYGTPDVVIPPGQFALLLSEEEVHIPNSAIGLVSVRTRFKMRGLISVSGFHVDPGFKGHLVFSVYNAGGSSVMISRGEKLFLLWIASLNAPTSDEYDATGSRYNQDVIRNEDVNAVGPQHFSPAEVHSRLNRVESTLRTILQVGVAVVAALTIAIVIWVADRGPNLDPGSAPILSPSSSVSVVP